MAALAAGCVVSDAGPSGAAEAGKEFSTSAADVLAPGALHCTDFADTPACDALPFRLELRLTDGVASDVAADWLEALVAPLELDAAPVRLRRCFGDLEVPGANASDPDDCAASHIEGEYGDRLVYNERFPELRTRVVNEPPADSPANQCLPLGEGRSDFVCTDVVQGFRTTRLWPLEVREVLRNESPLAPRASGDGQETLTESLRVVAGECDNSVNGQLIARFIFTRRLLLSGVEAKGALNCHFPRKRWAD